MFTVIQFYAIVSVINYRCKSDDYKRTNDYNLIMIYYNWII